jgi:hypothetical protein
MIFRRNKSRHEYRMVEMDCSMPAPGWIAICGVNFDFQGNVNSWSGKPMPLYAEGTRNVRAMMKEMKVAFRRPVLKESEIIERIGS